MSTVGPAMASYAWIQQLRAIYDYGHEVSPRDMGTLEIMAASTGVDMNFPIVHVPARKLDYRFMAAEALWITSGSNRLDFHPQIAEKLGPYSDNGETLYGAYGPPFVEQFNYVIHTLKKSPESRQAVINIWKPIPLLSKDIPCTIALQFLIRKDTLYTNALMRSSDVWMGLPYDIFSFTVMSTAVALTLGVSKLGTLQIFSGSLHLYERNRLEAESILEKTMMGQNTVWNIEKMTSVDDLKVWLTAAAGASSNGDALSTLTLMGDFYVTPK